MSVSTNPELEQFRRQWQEEVTTRRRRESRSNAGPSTALASAEQHDTERQIPNFRLDGARDGHGEGWLDGGSYNFDDLESRDEARRLGTSGSGLHPESKKEPQTALEHFEHAIEKEGQGNLSDSLKHYRRAYKLDDQVDRAYRAVHFPSNKLKLQTKQDKPVAKQLPAIEPSTKSSNSRNTAHHSLHGSKAAVSDLVASFAGILIARAVPSVEGDAPPPCPIAKIPHEVLMLILNELALADAASLMRASLVCKHFAYLTHAEDNLWRTVCFEAQAGFKDMKYAFALTHQWRDIPRPLYDPLIDDLNELSLLDREQERLASLPILPSLTSTCPSYQETFHSRPRLRFSGVYISTVNYIRSGMANSNSVYWGNSPAHMVTYYRYLRFYRDGSAISLLTFLDPQDVVPLFQKPNLIAAHKHAKDHPGSLVPLTAPVPPPPGTNQPQAPVLPPTTNAVMREARKARWRMSPLHESSETQDEKELEPEGNVYVESEGPTKDYIYHMQLALRSVKVSGVAKNTKLAWRSFWSYNSVSADWGEFALKNDRAFVFSRVKSWADA